MPVKGCEHSLAVSCNCTDRTSKVRWEDDRERSTCTSTALSDAAGTHLRRRQSGQKQSALSLLRSSNQRVGRTSRFTSGGNPRSGLPTDSPVCEGEAEPALKRCDRLPTPQRRSRSDQNKSSGTSCVLLRRNKLPDADQTSSFPTSFPIPFTSTNMPLRSVLSHKPVSGLRWLRRPHKRREALTANMISPPLGDLQHVSHIGGHAHHDSFGDLSFLQKAHSLLLLSSQSEQNLFLACTPPPKPPRLSPDTEAGGGEGGARGVTHKSRLKYSSLPLLDCEEEEEVVPSRAVHSPNTTGGGDLARVSLKETPNIEDDYTFTLDLGPSILDDVLRVMERLHQ